MCEEYNQLPEQEKYEITCAPHLGNYKLTLLKTNSPELGFHKKYFLVNAKTQFNLETMEKLSMDDCLLVDNLSVGSVEFRME